MKNRAVPESERTDHKGIVYDTQRKMCEAYGVPYTTYRARRMKGWSLKDSLENRLHDGPVTIGRRTDHTGKTYSSIDEMTAAYGISRRTYNSRLARGMTKEQALVFKGTRHVCDHLGNEYSTMNEMCRAYNIEHNTLWYRLQCGWSIKKALTTPVKKIENKGSKEGRTDHKGNVYSSKREMCKAYGISLAGYNSRLDAGLSKEEALTKPNRNGPEAVTDHLGNEYRSIRKMCSVYGIRSQVYRNRIKYGWGKEKALTTPVRKKEK